MVPMRSVPHRVICLLGLDDGAFPRAGVDDGDDVLARDPRVGERDPRSEDRQLLLDAVCAATEHLVVLYSGADARTGARRPPAVPLGELLDAVAATAGPALRRTRSRRPAPAAALRRPQLHRRRARRAEARSASTASSSTGAVAAAGAQGAAPAVPRRVRCPPPPRRRPSRSTTSSRSSSTPCKQFLRQRVGLPISDRDDDPADALPVALDALQRWAVGDRLLRDRLAGLDLARCRAAEWRRGELPPGELGNAVLAEVLDDVEELVAASARFVRAARAGVARRRRPRCRTAPGWSAPSAACTVTRRCAVEFSKLAAEAAGPGLGAAASR